MSLTIKPGESPRFHATEDMHVHMQNVETLI